MTTDHPQHTTNTVRRAHVPPTQAETMSGEEFVQICANNLQLLYLMKQGIKPGHADVMRLNQGSGSNPFKPHHTGGEAA